MIVVITIVGVGLVFLMNTSSKTAEVDPNNPEPSYQSNRWEPQLSLNNRDPYGLYVFEELMTSSGKFTQFNEYTDYALLDSLKNLDSSLYMYIGLDFTLTNKEVDHLLAGVARGNDLFLSVENTPNYLYSKLFTENPLTFNPDKVAPHIIENDTFDLYYLFEKDTLTEVWDLFSPSKLDQSDRALARTFGAPVFVKIGYGDGQVLIHLNPVTFTNFQLLRKEGKNYFKHIMDVFEKPQIQWLTFARYEPVEYDYDSGDGSTDNGLLSELFKHDAFRWAFIIGVFGVILYFIFRSKRERPVIPAITEAKNTGFSFVDTLSGIYFEGKRAPKMLKVMRQNFYSAVYRHFYIDLAHRKNQQPVESLAKKTGVDQGKITALLQLLESSGNIDNNYLVKVNKLQRTFYFESGIWDVEVLRKVKDRDIVVHRSKFQSMGILLSGILLIIFGFILLSSTIGYGILLWPLGIGTLAVGARMFGLPILTIHKDAITYHPLFGAPKRSTFKAIKKIQQDGDFIKITLDSGNEISVNLNLISPEYRETVKNLNTKINA